MTGSVQRVSTPFIVCSFFLSISAAYEEQNVATKVSEVWQERPEVLGVGQGEPAAPTPQPADLSTPEWQGTPGGPEQLVELESSASR